MQHLEEGTIHAWLDGALPATEAREVEQHVATCTECAAMVAEARGLIAGASRIASSLDVVRGNVIPKRPAGGAGKSLWQSLHLTPARAALAATLMIAVSTLLTVRHDTDNKLTPPVLTSAPASTSPGGASEARAQAPVLAPAPTPAAAPKVASAEAAKNSPALREKDRNEAVTKPKEESRADVAMDAIKPSADSIRAQAKSAVVAAAPPPAQAPLPVAGAVAANAMDSSFKKAMAKVGEVDSVRMGQDQLRAGRSFAARNSAPATLTMKCFQFVDPQPRGIPQRFALQSLAQDTLQRVVRAVDENGRLDTVIAGSTWTRATPTEITVRFASNTQPLTLPIRDAAFATSAVDTRQEAARRAGPSVNSLTCRP